MTRATTKSIAAQASLSLLLGAASLLAFHCTGPNEWAGLGSTGAPDQGPAGDAAEPEQVPPACDPDGHAPCPDDFFVCVDQPNGGKLCEGQAPAHPVGGSWDCEVQGTTLVCRGSEVPASAGDWYCDEVAPGEVLCRTHAYEPDDGGDGLWDCWYEGDHLVCELGEDDGEPEHTIDEQADRPDGTIEEGAECPPGVGTPTEEVCGDGIDNDCDGWTDEYCHESEEHHPGDDVPDDYDNPFDDIPPRTDGPPPDGCLCVPGAWRYCDTPTYCQWGIQYCRAGGMSWGRCRETSPPAACRGVASWYSPEAEACCVASGFCCQDMWDRDLDGDTWESLGNCTDIECR